MLSLFVFATCLSCLAYASTEYSCPEAARDRYVVRFRDKCYRFAVYSSRTFNYAQRTCASQGESLAVVHDKEVDDFLSKTLREKFSLQEEPVWIGLRRCLYNDTLKWMDGSTLTKDNYHNFQHPNGFSENYDCSAIIPKTGKWMDYICENYDVYGKSSKKKYICEFPATGPSTTTTPTTTTTTPTTTTTTPTTTTTTPTTTTTTPTTTTTTPTTTPTTPTTPGAKPTCSFITCDLDCGMDGYLTDDTTGCMICECNI